MRKGVQSVADSLPLMTAQFLHAAQHRITKLTKLHHVMKGVVLSISLFFFLLLSDLIGLGSSRSKYNASTIICFLSLGTST